MKNKSLIIILLLTVFTSHAQHSFFRGTNNYVAPAAVSTSQANALNFSTSLQNYAYLPPATYFSGDFTIECWVKPTAYSNWSRVIDFGNGAGSNNVLFGTSYGGSGKPGFYVEGAQFEASSQLPLNQWSHIAATLSGNTATIYINGIASGTSTFPIPANIIRNNNYIGRSNWGWGDPAPDASFDDLRIWNVAKTDAEILGSMNNELIGNESGLVAYFKFNEGVSCGNNTAITTLVNSASQTGSAYNATLTGFTLNGSCVSNFVTGKVANTAVTNGLVLNLDASNTTSYPGTGSTWTDLSGSSNNMSLFNGASYDPSNRNSILFDGVNDYVGKNTTLNTGQDFTISVWMYATLLGNTRTSLVANSYNYSSGNGWFFCTDAGGASNSFFLSIGSDYPVKVSSANIISINTWNYLTAVVKSGGRYIDLYKNGILISGATTDNGANTINYNYNNFSVGFRDPAGTPDPFHGNIGATQIYNRVLTANEVLQDFNTTKASYGL